MGVFTIATFPVVVFIFFWLPFSLHGCIPPEMGLCHPDGIANFCKLPGNARLLTCKNAPTDVNAMRTYFDTISEHCEARCPWVRKKGEKLVAELPTSVSSGEMKPLEYCIEKQPQPRTVQGVQGVQGVQVPQRQEQRADTQRKGRMHSAQAFAETEVTVAKPDELESHVKGEARTTTISSGVEDLESPDMGSTAGTRFAVGSGRKEQFSVAVSSTGALEELSVNRKTTISSGMEDSKSRGIEPQQSSFLEVGSSGAFKQLSVADVLNQPRLLEPKIERP